MSCNLNDFYTRFLKSFQFRHSFEKNEKDRPPIVFVHLFIYKLEPQQFQNLSRMFFKFEVNNFRDDKDFKILNI